MRGLAGSWIVVAAGGAEITGAIVSSTLIVWLAVVVLPQSSVAVRVAKLGLAGHWIVVAAGGAEITGASVSSTLIVWLAVLVFPHASLAVHVRVIEYFCGHVPDVVTSANVSVGLPSQASVAVGV